MSASEDAVDFCFYLSSDLDLPVRKWRLWIASSANFLKDCVSEECARIRVNIPYDVFESDCVMLRWGPLDYPTSRVLEMMQCCPYFVKSLQLVFLRKLNNALLQVKVKVQGLQGCLNAKPGLASTRERPLAVYAEAVLASQGGLLGLPCRTRWAEAGVPDDAACSWDAWLVFPIKVGLPRLVIGEINHCTTISCPPCADPDRPCHVSRQRHTIDLYCTKKFQSSNARQAGWSLLGVLWHV